MFSKIYRIKKPKEENKYFLKKNFMSLYYTKGLIKVLLLYNFYLFDIFLVGHICHQNFQYISL